MKINAIFVYYRIDDCDFSSIEYYLAMLTALVSLITVIFT